MSIDVKQFRDLILVPTLIQLGFHSNEAVSLMLGTALQESRLEYVKQLGGGPALGVYQVEPATHDDIWENYLKYKPDLAAKIKALSMFSDRNPVAQEMIGNLYYATAIARVHYLRDSDPIPAELEAQAEYYKRVFNTYKGAATVEEFIENYQEGTFGL